MASQPLTVASAELEVNPHEIFRFNRSRTPLVVRDDGVYITIRAADVERLATDPRTRQMETEVCRVSRCHGGAVVRPVRPLDASVQWCRPPKTQGARLARFCLQTRDGIAATNPRDREHVDRSSLRPRRDEPARRLCRSIARVVLCELLGIPPADISRFTRDVYLGGQGIRLLLRARGCSGASGGGGRFDVVHAELLQDGGAGRRTISFRRTSRRWMNRRSCPPSRP